MTPFSSHLGPILSRYFWYRVFFKKASTKKHRTLCLCDFLLFWKLVFVFSVKTIHRFGMRSTLKPLGWKRGQKPYFSGIKVTIPKRSPTNWSLLWTWDRDGKFMNDSMFPTVHDSSVFFQQALSIKAVSFFSGSRASFKAKVFEQTCGKEHWRFSQRRFAGRHAADFFGFFWGCCNLSRWCNLGYKYSTWDFWKTIENHWKLKMLIVQSEPNDIQPKFYML